jgi:nickel-dependent lactate racemase
LLVAVDRWNQTIEVDVPDTADVVAAQPRPEHPALADPLAAVRAAVERPYGMPPLSDLVSASSRVAIAFDDPLKYGPKYLAVPFLVEYLQGCGVSPTNITLISAGGTHDRPRREDFIGLYRGVYPVFLADFVDRFWPDRFLVHDAEDASRLVDMGTSALGDLVEHNRILLDSDLLIYCGSILPLIWGGYSGTGVVVGLASARSIFSHHRMQVIGSPESCHSDVRSSLFQQHKDAVMDRIEEFTGQRVFYVEGVPDPVGGWAGFFAGHFRALRNDAWRCADEQYVHNSPQYDVIVVGVPQYVFYGDTRNPLINLMAAATVARAWRREPLLRAGGAMVLVTACDGYIDPDLHPSHQEALRLFGTTRRAEAVEAHFERLRREPRYLEMYRNQHAYHGWHPIGLLNESQYVLDQAGLLVFASGKPHDTLEVVGATYAPDFQRAWEMVLPSYFSRVPMIFDVEATRA